MTTTPQDQELKDRLNLIENMIAEGRQSTESWGWTFVLWGIAYIVAIAWANLGAPFSTWSSWGHIGLAWPVTMIATVILTWIIGSRRSGPQAETTISRAISSIWIAMGISMFLLLLAVGISGKLEQQIFVSVIAAMLATANAASSLILKWRAQFFCAAVWWSAAIASAFCTVTQSLIVFLLAIFFGQIVFGSYMMLSEARERKTRQQRSGIAHA
jgi:hypothetical protein